MEPTRHDDPERNTRRRVMIVGAIVGLVLVLVAVLGPIAASTFYQDDGTGNPMRQNPHPKNTGSEGDAHRRSASL